MTKQTSIVPGSLSQLAAAAGQTLAETFMGADTLILVDTSASMGMIDPGINDSRYDRACQELTKLQANLQGRIAVVAFSTQVGFCPGGIPTNYAMMTNMTKALDYIKPADGVVDQIVLISDGEPNDEPSTLALAKQFTTKIDCIFIGPEGSPGAVFLKKLAAASGGTSQTIAQAGLLSERIERLMLAGGVA